jgi:hypothetical protein
VSVDKDDSSSELEHISILLGEYGVVWFWSCMLLWRQPECRLKKLLKLGGFSDTKSIYNCFLL